MIDAPLGLAFAAGLVATVNPCGFAMLPAYLSLFLTDPRDADRSGVRAGLRVRLIVTVAFVATFAIVGGIFRWATKRLRASALRCWLVSVRA